MVSLLLGIIYISFISLGLPDALLGAAWPTMYEEFRVPVSYMGPVALLISTATVVSTLLTDRLVRRFGTGRVTAFSVAITAVSLLGFSAGGSYWMLLVWAIPYGLGAGAVDAGLNNYVAVHYASRHMSWLHCMWGLGAAAGPYIMGFVLTGGQRWNMGYLSLGAVQLVLTAVLFLALPLWKKSSAESSGKNGGKGLSIRQILHLPGAKAILLTFFCYCALEQTAGQWAASYLNLHIGFSQEQSASLAGLFYLGLTVGRAVSGFLTIWLNDRQMIRLGMGALAAGLAVMLLPLGAVGVIVGLVLAGLGSAPIFPCIIHSTPNLFGEENSQSVIGVLMAGAYFGTCVMPAAYGWITGLLGIRTLPTVLLLVFAAMASSYKCLCKDPQNQRI